MNPKSLIDKKRAPRRNPAYLIFTLSLAIMTASALLLLSECWETYATARYWRQVAGKRTEKLGENWTQQDMLPGFRALYAENPDIVAWLRVENTTIDYPVMQTKDDPEYYLHRAFDKTPLKIGAPFADYRCQVTPVQGFNTIVYLHDRLMVELNQYTYWPPFLETHRTLRFDTLTEEGVYQVIAAFYANVNGAILLDPWNPDDEQAYEYYNYLEVDSPEGFQKYAADIRRRQLAKTDADFSPRSHLLTLICCATSFFSGVYDTGRLVVIAKRVGP